MAAPNTAEDICDYLINTVGLTPTTVGFLAREPIAQYAVVEYPGPDNVKTHGNKPGVRLDECFVQVMARHSTAQTARNNIMTVVDALDGLQNTTINSVVYTYIRLKGRPRLLERLEDGTAVYIAEFHTQARR